MPSSQWMPSAELESAALSPPAQTGTLRALLRSMRPKQWPKNLLLFAGFLFTLNVQWAPFTESMWAYLGRASAAFGLFCLLSSGVYILNDIRDIDKDRRHPQKRHRPLASGALSPRLAATAAVCMLLFTLAGAYTLRPLFFLLCLVYLLMQVAYTLSFKHMVILDVFTIAIGFVLRAVSGAVAIHVAISPWLYIVTLLGALFLGLAKRRHELILLSDDAAHHRKILQEYSPAMLDQMISIVTAATIMAYSLYTFTSPSLPKNHGMMLTIPLVIYGIFRYLYLIHKKDAGGSPEEVLLRDRPVLITIVLWVGSAAAILGLSR